MLLVGLEIMELLADGKYHSAIEIGSYLGISREHTIKVCNQMCKEGKLVKGVKSVLGFCAIPAYRRL